MAFPSNLILGAVLALAAAPAMAGEVEADAPVSTADKTAGPPPAEAPPPLGAKPLERDPFYAPQAPIGARPHGVVSLGVGTGGYRELAGAVVVPLGENGEKGEVAAAISVVQGTHGRGTRR